MNKKAFFMPLFVVSTFLVLGILLYSISSANAQKDDVVGGNAVALIKTYDEGEKIMIYLDKSAVFAAENSFRLLADNGGFASKSDCETINDFVIVNSCKADFNPQASFNKILNSEFSSYLFLYKSSYQSFNPDKVFLSSAFTFFGLIPEEVEPAAEYSYSSLIEKKVKDSKIVSSQYENNKLILGVSEIKLDVEGINPQPLGSSYYIIKPRINVNSENLEVYNELYNSIAVNCINKEFSECNSYLQQQFKGMSVVRDGVITKLTLPLRYSSVKMAFNSNQPLKQLDVFQAQ
ncbi:MAG TPA: hypothetical protein VJG30_04395 [Candidatus Nanoarchaeia archaeon]|nr:hypothetical protein [Candidatus Nanoarchaeia archaeon]